MLLCKNLVLIVMSVINLTKVVQRCEVVETDSLLAINNYAKQLTRVKHANKGAILILETHYIQVAVIMREKDMGIVFSISAEPLKANPILSSQIIEVQLLVNHPLLMSPLMSAGINSRRLSL